MRTQTFTYNGATITVRRATVRDRLARDMVLSAVATEDYTAYEALVFARLVSQTVSVEGDVGFPFPTRNATPEELRAGMNAWLDAESELFEAWEAALNEVSRPVTSDEPEKKVETPTT